MCEATAMAAYGMYELFLYNVLCCCPTIGGGMCCASLSFCSGFIPGCICV